jgi:hypothetical protein
MGPPIDLREFIDRHPEKMGLYMFVVTDALVRLPFFWLKVIFEKTRLAFD